MSVDLELRRRVAPGRAAVIVVDVQNDFCHEAGAFGQAGHDMGPIQQAVGRLEGLLEAARAAGVPVVFIRTTHDATTSSPAWRNRKGARDAVAWSAAEETCVTGSWGAEFYRVAPRPGEPVVTKHRYSGFIGTNLDLILRTLGRESLLFTGVATNVCVESTLRDGLMLDYDVTLVADCCGATSAEAQRATEENVRRYFGLVTDSEAIVPLWAARPAVQPAVGGA